MNVNLTPKLEDLVRKKVASGLYNSASEVIRESLRLLEERDRLRETRLEELRKEVAIGLEQLESGKRRSSNAEDIKRKVRERIAAQRKQR